MDNFNHFRIKRRAHKISRQGNETWNIFRHLSATPRRAETWNGGRLEAQLEASNDEDLTHAATSPYPNSGNVRDISTSGTGQGTEDASGKCPSEDSHDIPLIDRSSQLRYRKEESEDTVNQIPVDEPDTTKTGKIRQNGFLRHVHPKEPFTVANQLQRILFVNRLNLLLPLVPAGIALHATRGNSIETFIVNFLATFPLQNMANLALDEIQLRVEEVFGNLLYITMYNLFQLISCILLLINKEIVILQTTLIGGILANILLVLGLSFIVGGLNRTHQCYNNKTTPVLSNLLSLSATSLLIPTASKLLGQTSDDGLAKQSRGASVILIIVYFLFLVYQLITHRTVFSEQSEKVPVKRRESDKSFSIRSPATSTQIRHGLVASAQVGSIMIDTDNGRDHWIQGVLLLADWALIAIAAYFVDLGPYGRAPIIN